MPRLMTERRRHPRTPLACPTVLLDKGGHFLFRGRAVDISLGGIRVMGEGGPALRENMSVWVELTVPSVRKSGPGHRAVKVCGEVRRINVMGSWKSVVVVIFDADFTERLLDPML
jgi:hypothetical protein